MTNEQVNTARMVRAGAKVPEICMHNVKLGQGCFCPHCPTASAEPPVQQSKWDWLKQSCGAPCDLEPGHTDPHRHIPALHRNEPASRETRCLAAGCTRSAMDGLPFCHWHQERIPLDTQPAPREASSPVRHAIRCPHHTYQEMMRTRDCTCGAVKSGVSGE